MLKPLSSATATTGSRRGKVGHMVPSSEDTSGYIAFLEREVASALLLACQVGETLKDDHRLCTQPLKANALLWLSGAHWN